MDLFERVMQTGRGHQREIRDVLGLGYGGVPGRETTPHRWTSLSSHGNDKEDIKVCEQYTAA